MTKLSSEHKELEERLQEERTQKEQFKNMKNDIEDERRLLDRTVEKLQREVSVFDGLRWQVELKFFTNKLFKQCRGQALIQFHMQ